MAELYRPTWDDLSDQSKLAWAAGLFEGEGCFSMSMTGDRPDVRISLVSTDIDVLQRLQSIIPSDIKHHTYGRQPDKGKYQWTFQIGSSYSAYRWMELLLPYMCERRTARIQEVMDTIYNFRSNMKKPVGTDRQEWNEWSGNNARNRK